MKFIYSNKLDKCEIDDIDYDLANYRWYMRNGYFATTINKVEKYLHKIIGERLFINNEVDHEDRNKLNCKRNNLREATRSQNQSNCNKYSTNTSGYKGVHYCNYTNKWRASITINRKCLKLGRFDNIIQAAKAYDDAAKVYHKEFAVLNFE